MTSIQQNIRDVVVGDRSIVYTGIFTSHKKGSAQQALFFREMYDRLHEISAASPGTCSWILRSPDLVEWQSSQHGLLSIKGKPGTGKSTILKYMWNHFAQVNASKPLVMASFFCHGRGASLQRSGLGVFRALLYQIIHQVPHLETEIEEKFQARCATQRIYGTAWDWTESELKTLLADYILRSCRGSELLILIDALDECGATDAREVLEYFQGLVNTSEAQHCSGLKICVSSRDYPLVLVRAGLQHQVVVDGENLADIQTYVAQKLDLFREGTRKFDELLSSITSRAGYIFQWSVLVVARVIRSLEGKKRVETILQDVEETPLELDSLYRQIVRSYLEDTNINARDKQEFRNLFQWVALARRPLSLLELESAVIVPPSDRDILHPRPACDAWYEDGFQCAAIEHMSYGLMSVVEMPRPSRTGYDRDVLPHRVIQFVHHSIQEYFSRGGIEDLQVPGSIPQVAVRAAELAIVELCYKAVRSVADESDMCSRVRDVPTEYPLLEYGLEYIFEHAKSAGQGRSAQDDLIHLLKWPQENCVAKLEKCLKFTHICTDRMKIYSTRNLLHIAAAFDIPSLISSVLDWTPQMSINSSLPWGHVDWGGKTALHIAAGQGSCSAVRRLLKFRQASPQRFMFIWPQYEHRNLNVNARDGQGCTPLMRAAENGHTKIVDLLSKTQDADLDAKTRSFGYTALHLAISSGHIATADLLIKRGADIRVRDGKRSTILYHVLRYALYGSKEFVQQEMFALFWKLLLRAKEDLCHRGNLGDSPLSLGLTSSRSLEFAHLLLDNGFKPNVPDVDGNIWLSYFMPGTHPETYKLLLSQPDTDPNYTNRHGLSLLARLVSSYTVSTSTMRMFLEDSEVHVRDRDGNRVTLLMMAAGQDSLEAVRKLLANGKSEPTATENFDRHALEYASTRRDRCQDPIHTDTPSEISQSLAAIRARVREELRFTEEIIKLFSAAYHINDDAPRGPSLHAPVLTKVPCKMLS